MQARHQHPFHQRFAASCLTKAVAGLLSCALPLIAQADDAKQIEFFEARIRPVLVKHCYECHSAEGDEISGGLAVDSAAGMLTGGDSGPSLIAGKPDESLLLEALRYEGLEMPPEGRLPDQVIADFEKWIAMGAADPRTNPVAHSKARVIDIEQGRQFWSFQPVRQHQPPTTENSTWATSEIDAFVLSALEQANLNPAADADAESLVRRLYFDLTGLPPTAEQVQSFVSDPSPEAYEALVNQLLDSQQFGVHWARHWLDVARYADSNGGDFNATFHNAWRYRDYVVDAMNGDKPFNQFVREQIAGDLLPYDSDDQRTEQLVATGFLMLGTKMLSERDKDKLQMDVVDEQINTVGSAFLGMTLGCARCHDHKFDPVPTEDYYALAGIFKSTRTLEGESQKYVSTWQRTDLPADPEHVAAVKQHSKLIKDSEAELKAAKKSLESAEKELKALSAFRNSVIVDDADAQKTGTWTASTHSPTYVGKGYIHDNQGNKGQMSVRYTVNVPASGTYELRVSYTHGGNRSSEVPITIQHADQEITVSLDQTRKPQIDDLFSAIGQWTFAADMPVVVTVSNQGTTGYVMADAIQLVEVDPQGVPIAASGAPDSQQADEIKQKAEQAKQAVADLEEKIKQLKKDAPPKLPQAIAASELPQIGNCEVCIRGEHRNRGPEVSRGFLQVALTREAPSFSDQESGRRELAEWIADPQNPLTGRVIVNRAWYHLIGEGLVRSVDNFGSLGERPTHPELLDNLAARFVATGDAADGHKGYDWSLKSLIREIVLSHTYRISSEHNEAAWQADPENRLLWRAHRKRLPAEAIRDAMLTISGGLDLSAGSSPVEGLGTLVTTNNADDKGYQAGKTLRRSVYLPIIRNELPAELTVFDFADPDLVVGKRPVTNVPAQALLLMNSPFVINSARGTAESLLGESTEISEQLISDTYLTVLSRQPSAQETARAMDFLRPDNSGEGDTAEPAVSRLTRFVHVLFASTEFRMLN